METGPPNAKPIYRTLRLTPERELPMPHRIARAAIIIYFFTFFASGSVLCTCPGFFLVMAVCAVVALNRGSRNQRILSAGLLIFAVAGFIFQLREEYRFIQRASRAHELHDQRPTNQ